MNDVLRRIATVYLVSALPILAAHAAEPAAKDAALPKPVLLPGEYAVTRYDLARGSGTNWRGCLGHTTIGPGIAPADLEVTYVKENSIRIAIKGTGDALVCNGFYTPPMRDLAHKTVFRFYDANRWSFEDIDKRTNLRALATPASAGQSSRPAPAPTPAPSRVAASSSTQIFKCVGTGGKVTYTATPCPDKTNPRQQGAAPASAPALPTVQRGLWKLKSNHNGSESQSDHCGDPLENFAMQLRQISQVQKMGCTARTASSAPRNFSMIVDCPTDWVSADGSQSRKKGQTNMSLDSPTPQSFTMNLRSTSSDVRETVQGVRVGSCQ